jgi:hypothetical protein
LVGSFVDPRETRAAREPKLLCLLQHAKNQACEIIGENAHDTRLGPPHLDGLANALDLVAVAVAVAIDDPPIDDMKLAADPVRVFLA